MLYVGSFDPRSGIETLVRAVSLSAVPKADLKLIIGGGWRAGESDGKERDRIGSIVEELGLSDITSFPGGLSRDILPANDRRRRCVRRSQPLRTPRFSRH